MHQDSKRYMRDFDEKYGFDYFDHKLTAGQTYPLHWHDFIEFELYVSGKAKHILNAEEYIAKRGSAHILNCHDFHEIQVLEDTGILCIQFNKDMLHPKVIEFLNHNTFRCEFDEKETQEITKRILKLIAEKEKPDTLRNIMIKNLINELMIDVIRKYSPVQLKPTPLPIQQAVAYLNAHFYEKITLEKVAKELSFSSDYIGKLFKNQMNRSFNDYLNALRLKHACSLLKSSNMSMKEIANASGFSSIEYFMHAFKKKMMMTPGEYRKQK